MRTVPTPLPAILVLALSACAARPTAVSEPRDEFEPIRVTEHRGSDDLLTAGLGLDGLRAATAPPPADPALPTASELRRRAVHANWRGIVHLADPAFAPIPVVPGREYAAFARVPGARHPHRVLAQVPDAFDRRARCLVVAPASGSRGVYGAIGFAGSWALARGCAVAYTDKGAGTDFFDLASDTGVALDGTRAARGSAALGFEPAPAVGAPGQRVAIPHAHSQDNPEADWGHHTLQAARFGLEALNRAFPDQAPFTPDNTRVIAAAVSNGGGAVLKAGELDDEGLLDAVVAAAPNILPPDTRALYDFASEAALLQPCALLALDGARMLLPEPVWRAAAEMRCASLRAAGRVDGADAAAQSRDALARLRASGWEDGPLALAGFHVGIDVWRALMATYTQAYARAPWNRPLCGYGFAALGADGEPRTASAAERALWWSDGVGVAPTAGVGIVDTLADGPDPSFPGLACARALWEGDSADGAALRAGVEATRASARSRVPWTVIVHGADDGLVPAAFTGRAYAAALRAGGARVDYVEVPRAQHFDALLALPLLAAFQPLNPHAHAALDRVWAAIAPR